MDAIEWMVSVSSHYPAIMDFLVFLSAALGVGFILLTLKTIIAVHVTQTVPESKATFLAIIGMLSAGAFGVSIAWTMSTFTNSIFDIGGAYVLEDLRDTSAFAVQGGSSALAVMQQFVLATFKVTGLIFGVWGMVVMYKAMTPEGDRGDWSGGLIRIIVGGAFFRPKEILNIFGNFGDKFFHLVHNINFNTNLLEFYAYV